MSRGDGIDSEMIASFGIVLKPLPVPKRPLDSEIEQATRGLEKAIAKASEARAKLEALKRAQQELISALVEEHRSLDLHTEDAAARVNYMNIVSSDAPKKIGRPIMSDHPFVARALKLHGSIKAAATALGVHPSTARSWYAEGDDARPISETMAARLAKSPWNIPRSAWRKIG